MIGKDTQKTTEKHVPNAAARFMSFNERLSISLTTLETRDYNCRLLRFIFGANNDGTLKTFLPVPASYSYLP